jgi:histidinol phosphatase-like enzyme
MTHVDIHQGAVMATDDILHHYHLITHEECLCRNRKEKLVVMMMNSKIVNIDTIFTKIK